MERRNDGLTAFEKSGVSRAPWEAWSALEPFYILFLALVDAVSEGFEDREGNERFVSMFASLKRLQNSPIAFLFLL